VAQCLLVVSEDNPAAWKVLAEHATAFQNILQLDGSHKAAILRTVIAGVCSNVPVLSMQNFNSIIEAISKTLEINHRQVLNEITSRLPLNEGEAEKNAPAVEIIDDDMEEETETDASARRLREDMPTQLDNDIKDVGYLLSAQRTAAEILTNICTIEDNDMGENMDDSDPESVHDYDVTENGNQVSADKISNEISEAIQAHKIVEKVRQNFIKRKCRVRIYE
jgi:hypothetical protein